MGHYIQTPENHNKAEQIRDIYGATILPGARYKKLKLHPSDRSPGERRYAQLKAMGFSDAEIEEMAELN